MFCTHASAWCGARCDRAPRSSRRPNLVEMKKSSCGPHAGPRSGPQFPSLLSLFSRFCKITETALLSHLSLCSSVMSPKNGTSDVWIAMYSGGSILSGIFGLATAAGGGASSSASPIPWENQKPLPGIRRPPQSEWGLPEGPDLRRSVMGKPMAGRPRAQAGVMAAKAVRMVRLIQSMFLQP
jgi:hypothetical protein